MPIPRQFTRIVPKLSNPSHCGTPLTGGILLVGLLSGCQGSPPDQDQASEAPARPSGLQVAQEFYDPMALGPYGIGVRSIEVRARHHGREPLETLIWYPSDVPADSPLYVYYSDEESGDLVSQAVENAPVHRDTAPYRAVAFSHGNGGVSFQSVFLTEHLASHGYVVISCHHPGNTFLDYNPTTLITGGITRPLDISSLIDALEDLNLDGTDPLFATMDLSGVGMTGHSFGGYTTLAVAGARLNLTLPDSICRWNPDSSACREARSRLPLTGDRGLLLDLSDSRVTAAAPLAPLGWEPFREEGLSYLEVPIQIHGGGLDDTCPMETQVAPVYTYASGPKSMLELFDAGHYAYSDMCLLDPNFDECFPPFIPMDLAHDIINLYVTSHFKVFLEADSRYESYLTLEYAEAWAATAQWWETLGL